MASRGEGGEGEASSDLRYSGVISRQGGRGEGASSNFEPIGIGGGGDGVELLQLGEMGDDNGVVVHVGVNREREASAKPELQ